MKRLHSLAAIGLLIVISRNAIAAGAPAPDIWFGGIDPVIQNDRHADYQTDYMELFKPDAPWPVTAGHTKVFRISTQLVLRGSDEQLKTVIDFVRSRHIGLTIELGVLTYSKRCGGGLEGYGAPLAVEAVARRIKSLGGQLDYIDMDEPIVWGHLVKRPNRCQDSISDLVDQITPKLAILKKYFPSIQIGQIDAIASRFPTTVDDLVGFADVLRAKTGVRLGYIIGDVGWRDNWRPQMQNLVQRMHARGIRVGVVSDGDADAGSDEAWVAQAFERCKAAMSMPQPLDPLVIGSWEPLPERLLPETQPGTLSYLAKHWIETGR